MRVVMKVRGSNGDLTDIQYYSGDSLAQAMHAATMCMAEVENQEKWYTIESVVITF